MDENYEKFNGLLRFKDGYTFKISKFEGAGALQIVWYKEGSEAEALTLEYYDTGAPATVEYIRGDMSDPENVTMYSGTLTEES